MVYRPCTDVYRVVVARRFLVGTSNAPNAASCFLALRVDRSIKLSAISIIALCSPDDGIAMDLHVRRLSNLRSLVDAELTGGDLIELMRELFPICRSITGDGLRRASTFGNAIDVVNYSRR